MALDNRFYHAPSTSASKGRGLEPEREDALTRRGVTRYRMLTTLCLFGALGKNPPKKLFQKWVPAPKTPGKQALRLVFETVS